MSRERNTTWYTFLCVSVSRDTPTCENPSLRRQPYEDGGFDHLDHVQQSLALRLRLLGREIAQVEERLLHLAQIGPVKG